MGNKMLIDAAHPEETRVVVVRGNRVEEFDFESRARKQLRGSIFLAKVIRVEQSLQAAFVDYGGNRHGFLAFSEIHPDYYRIPYADSKSGHDAASHANGESQAKKNGTPASGAKHDPASAAPHREDHELADASDGNPQPGGLSGNFGLDENSGGNDDPHDGGEVPEQPPYTMALDAHQPQRVSEAVHAGDEPQPDVSSGGHDDMSEHRQAGERSAAESEAHGDPHDGEDDGLQGAGDDNGYQETIESIGGEDALEELPQRERPRRRLYKIHEVIKRNQILLVQVVKEERGNKGAALTTYLSLAGRYTVLMPNTASGGGISRKIASAADRKRLREIAVELEVPQGMGLIVRTAGAARTKAEIKRDFEYLLRLWENVRDLTLKSKAPTLVYEEGDLIKRSIRDLYNREIDEVLVAGDDAYREAKDFMRMLMPSHAKHVQPYKEPEPIFLKHGVENQLNLMFNPRVTLKSGGYIIINQTEALVAIDVNSGKSTREHSIEETALKTNLEAAEEIARQLRLRDLAGLIVIDFIDMEEKRNNRSVERKLKDCLRNDRARIQVGRISPFGLLEMSRQRLRTGVVEGSTRPCHVCDGTGVIRSTESVALMILRAIEDLLIAKGPANLAATTSVDAALYILNNKRGYLKDIEQRYGVTITISASEHMHGAAYTIDKISQAVPRPGDSARIEAPKQIVTASAQMPEIGEFEDEDEDADTDTDTRLEGAKDSQEPRSSRRRRRRKRYRNGQEQFPEAHAQTRHGHAGFPADEAAPYVNGARPSPPARVSGDALTDAPEHMRVAGADEAGGRREESGEELEERRSRRSRRRGRRGGQRQRALRAAKAETTTAAGEHGDAAAEMRSADSTSADDGGLAAPAMDQMTGAVLPDAAVSEPPAQRKPREPRRAGISKLTGAAPMQTGDGAALPEMAAAQPGPAPDAPKGTAADARHQASPETSSAPVTADAARDGQPVKAAEAETAVPARKPGPARAGWWQRRIGG